MEKIISVAAWLILMLSQPLAIAQNKDIEWLRSINSQRNTSLDGAVDIIMKSSYPVSLGLPAGQLAAGYLLKDKNTIHNGWQSLAALGTTTVITFGLKYAVNRDRPYEKCADIKPDHYDTDGSLPSGHTSIAFSTATSLSLQYRKWYIIAPAYAWAAAVGYSRLRQGMHYPSDVFVGALVGAGSAFLCHKGHQWLHKRKHSKQVQKVE